ncbi:MAG: xanthine dehydrogenase family protein subunit M [Actinobacteria bacterium]|nr:xanthine dehydrogenase family protein subunit M [Actinomycetota bacterium]
MKPSPFRYIAPLDLDEALSALAASPDTKVLAGGQSLVPAMNLRLTAPGAIIDINGIPGYDRVTVAGGTATIGMLVRHMDLARPGFDDPLAGALAEISQHVGHLPIRTRGTFVGSLVHADPAAEWCALALATEATVVARSAGGTREIPAAGFFLGPFTTALREDEIVTEVRIPLLGSGTFGFAEIARTAGDFATVAALALVRLDGDAFGEVRIGLAGAESTPSRPSAAETSLAGQRVTTEAIAEAATIAADSLQPIEDAQCSSGYRRHLAKVLVMRALQQAVGRAA